MARLTNDLSPRNLEFEETRCGAEHELNVKEYPMNTGTVMWFNNQKGFGFIQPDNGNKDVFVHITAVERAGMNDLREGQKVSFDIVSDSRTGKSAAENLQAA